MSKTDKTKPWSVRAVEAGPKAVHNHTNGSCDLPPMASKNFGWRRGGDHCYWTESFGFYYGKNGGCGCRSCTGQDERRYERRKDRHNAVKRELADL